MPDHTDDKGEFSIARSKTAKRLRGPRKTRKVLIIRHGATALNSDDSSVDRIRGTMDWPLTEQGKDEARKLADKIAANPPDVLLYSDLIRAADTAKIISGILNIQSESTGRDFRPWDVGEFTGQKSSEAIPILAKYATEMQYRAVPGGESFNSFRSRFLGGLLRALQTHKGFIGIVTHHRDERLLKAIAKAGWTENGAIDDVEFTKKGETTGHCEIVAIPVERLELWSEWAKIQAQYTPAFGDGREEMWLDWVRNHE